MGCSQQKAVKCTGWEPRLGALLIAFKVHSFGWTHLEWTSVRHLTHDGAQKESSRFQNLAQGTRFIKINQPFFVPRMSQFKSASIIISLGDNFWRQNRVITQNAHNHKIGRDANCMAWPWNRVISDPLYILNAREKKIIRPAGVRNERHLHWAGIVAAGPWWPPRSSAPRTCNIERRMRVGWEGPRGAATDSSSKKRISMHVWPRRRPPRN